MVFYGSLVIVGLGIYYWQRHDDHVKVEVRHEHSVEQEQQAEELHFRNIEKELHAEHAEGDFHSVVVSGNYEVTLATGENAYRIEGNRKLDDRIKVYIRDGVLNISTKEKLRKGEDIKLFISAPRYHRIIVSGAVDMESEDVLQADELKLQISGAGDVDLEVAAQKLEVGVSGAGDLELEGQAREANMSISGAGKIEADELELRAAKVAISGAGNAELNVSDRLEVAISGAGAVSYKGSPELHKRISGFGHVRKVD